MTGEAGSAGGVSAVVCPDKFRGSMSAIEAADAMVAGLGRAGVTDVRAVPLADGGEGTLDTLLAARGGTRRTVTVTGPIGRPVDAELGILSDGTAVVEMARASGLTLVTGEKRPLDATTAGTGELIAAAIRGGASRVLVGVGGSATTDGGLGAVEALDWTLRGAEVVVACDVQTCFVDAAPVFGPQKGATPAQVELLTRRLEALAGRYVGRTGVDVRSLAGSGAAGGLAGGLAAIGARLEPGFDVVAGAAGLDDALDGVSLLLTGEGSLDRSSFEGKVVGGALRWGEAAGIARRAVVAGAADADGRAAIPGDVRLDLLVDRAGDEAGAHRRAAELTEEAAADAARWAREA